MPFYKELGNQGLKATDVPVVAFSVGEEELRGVDTKPLVGHLAAWNYFMSIKNPTNTAFIKAWSNYAKANNIPGHKDRPLTNDPMEATYIGIHMWAQAVKKAGSTDTDKVIAAMAGQTFPAPSGITSKMDENYHLWKSVFIGEIKGDGQFNVVWKTPGPVRAQPWSQSSPRTRARRTSRRRNRKSAGTGAACASGRAALPEFGSQSGDDLSLVWLGRVLPRLLCFVLLGTVGAAFALTPDQAVRIAAGEKRGRRRR